MKTEKIPQTKHEFGKWITAEGSVWNAPIVKKRTCNVCDAEEVKNIYFLLMVKCHVIADDIGVDEKSLVCFHREE